MSKANKAKKKTFWPYGIVLSIVAIILACVATIIFASNFPVYEDDFYFEKYQSVESNFSEISAKQAKFDESFKLSLNLQESLDKRKRVFYELSKEQNEINIFINELGDLNANELKPTLLLTRPHTNEQDTKLDAKFYLANEAILNEDGVLQKGLKARHNTYALKTFLPSLKPGRWQLKLKLEADNSTSGFFSFNLFVQE